MGMRVSGAASGSGMAAWQTRRQDFSNLASAIRGGDLGAAQQAFATLQSLNQSNATAAGATSSSTTASGSGDLNAVGQALGNNDIKAAEQALTNMFAGGAGGHHHRHGGQAASSTTSSSSAPTLPVGTTISTLA